MRDGPRIHRSSANAAAVLMTMLQVVDIIASLSISNLANSTMLDLFSETMVTVLLVAVLLRGRKDEVAGMLLLGTLAVPLWSAGVNLFSVLVGYDQVLYACLYALSQLAIAVFRGLCAAECLSPSKISTGAGRGLFRMLPIMGLLCAAGAHALLCLNSGSAIVPAIAFYVTPRWLGPVFMGISFSARSKTTIDEK